MPATTTVTELVELAMQVVETYLSELGEEFAAAIASERSVPLKQDRLESIVIRLVDQRSKDKNGSIINAVVNAVRDVLLSDNDAINDYIKVASDAYTLLAFLAEVPDVQKATKKLFGHGEIWLDTTVLLPLSLSIYTP